MSVSPPLNEMTCDNCGKKIAEVKMTDGIVSIVCPKCGVKNTHETKPKSIQNAAGQKVE